MRDFFNALLREFFGPPAANPVARELRELSAAQRQVRGLLARGEVDPEPVERVDRALEARRMRLLADMEDRRRPAVVVVPKSARDPEVRREADQPPRRTQPASSPPMAAAIPVVLPEKPEAVPGPLPISIPTAPPLPRKRLTRLLAAFMEERNILWGELVGGLLIVGCSVALVITLWKSLERLPYFPFLIFTSVTTALFGAGLYTLHHWKLTATSRGLLVITLLLTPLNLLVLTEPSGGPPGGWLELGAKLLALLLFTGLVFVAGRDLIGPQDLPAVVDRRWLLALAVVGGGAAPLLAPRSGDPRGEGVSLLLPLLLLGFAPAACHGLAVGAALVGLSRGAQKREENSLLRPSQAYALFLFVGASTFAAATALGFLTTRGGNLADVLHTLSIPLVVCGAPILSAGLLVYRRTPTPTVPDADATAAGVRTAATGVALGGLAVLVAGVALAWPAPAALVAVCAWGGAVLTVVAFRHRLPSAHAVGLAFLAFGVLIAVHLAAGGLSPWAGADGGVRLAMLLHSSTSAVVWTAFALAAAAGAEALARGGRRGDAVVYLAAAGAAALGAVGLAIWHGFDEPGRAALVCGLCGAGALAVNFRWRRAILPYIGLGLCAAAGLWGLWWARSLGLSCNLPGADGSAHGVCGLVLAAAALALAAAAAALRGDADTALGQLGRAAHDVAAALGLFGAVSVVEPTFAEAAPRAAAAAVLAAAALVLAGVYGRRLIVWCGSAFVLAAIIHLLVGVVGETRLPRPLAVALLGHATLTLLTGLAVSLIQRGTGPEQNRLFGAPLRQSALLTSSAVAPLLLIPDGSTAIQAGYTAWLAALWLTAAWARRSPGWFTAFQTALTAAVLLGATAWLQTRDWVQAPPLGLADPRALHGYGIALAALGLAWVAARTASSAHPVARDLWPTARPSFDRVVLGGLVVAQAALALWGIAPGVPGELVPARFAFDPGWPAVYVHAYGPGAWLLLGCLAVVLIAETGASRGRIGVVPGLVTAALTVPVLTAGPFAAETAVASALRWGTAACFLGCAAVLWFRGTLGRLASMAGVTFDPGCSRAARRLLVAAAAVLILSLTAAVAALGFAGEQPAGPDAASFFARVGWTASNVVPLVVLSLGLAGFGVRERSPGYAFAAGVVADVSLMGGYALAVVTGGAALDAVQLVRIVQLGGLGAALWALGWLLARPWVFAWRETPAPEFVPVASARPLMLLQTGAALAGNALLLVPALVIIALPATVKGTWTVEVGSPLGWLTLLAALTAPAVRRGQQGTPVSWPAAFLAGAAILGLLACNLERAWPGAGYRALLFGGAAYALLWALTPFPGRRPPAWLKWLSLPTFGQASYAVLLLGALVVVLALQGATLLHDALAASTAVAVVAAAVATTAYGRASDGLAFLGGLCGNLAATLLTTHFHPNASVVDLVQVNVAACAGAALLWQGTRRFLRGGPVGGGLLTFLALLGLVAHTVLLLAPLGLLLLTPSFPLPAALAAAGGPGGWLALLLAAAAALWRLAVVQPQARIHVLGLTGLSAGVLAACAVAPWDAGHWLSYHVLTFVWAGLGFAVTAVGSIAFALRVGLGADGGSHAEGFAALFPARRLRRWLEGVGLAVAALAVAAGGADPYRPYTPATAVLAVSVMAGALALWFRRFYHVYASGLLFTAAGVMVWSAWGAGSVRDFSLTVALGLAVAGAFWAAVERAMRPVWRLQDEQDDRAAPSPFDPPFPVPSFAHAAACLGLGILVLSTEAVLFADAVGGATITDDSLFWATAAALATGMGVCLWDRRAIQAPAGLYVLGLAAVGLGLHAAGERAADLGWSASLALAGYAASVAALLHVARRADLGRLLHLPSHPAPWLLPAQACVACVVVALSGWMCVGFDALGARLGGPAAVAVLAAGGLAAVGARSNRWNEGLRAAVLLLTVMAAAETAAALPDPSGLAAWLDRDVLLVPTLTVIAILYGAALPLLAGRAPAWAAWGRRLAPTVGGLALLALAALLAQEFRLYDPGAGRTPMGTAGMAVVACAIALLAAASVAAAVYRGRARFVYAAEVVVALLFVHLRLNVPELFDPSAARYWTLIVVAVAFLGVGLSEFFQRRGLGVLAAPLQRTGVFLPLLPLLAFWVRPPEPLWTFADLHAPGMRPFLTYLETPAGAFDGYAQVWLLVALLYACLAAVRRSPLYALLAALAANCGLWSLLTHYQIVFILHPQAWLIPAGLILLAAEHRNRQRLRPELGLGLRYLGLTLVYVSSTADLFIAGVGNSAALPVVLAVLAVLGALAGLWLRVRAFLFLGVSFLALDVCTMIWHAAVDREQTWVWWACGIVLGAAILTLFAVFEKRRNDVIRLMEDVRGWD